MGWDVFGLDVHNPQSFYLILITTCDQYFNWSTYQDNICVIKSFKGDSNPYAKYVLLERAMDFDTSFIKIG